MLESINCPSCGASNQLPDGKTSMFCAFCGGSIQKNFKKEDDKKSNISKSLLVEAFIGGSIRGKKLSYLNRKIERIDEITDIYSDSEIEEIKDLNLSNNLIKSLDGIDRFKLNLLNLSNNKLTIIDKLPRFDGTLIVTSFPMYVEFDFSNNLELMDFSDEVLNQIENPGYSEIRNFILNFDGCPNLNLENFINLNFSKYATSSDEAVFFIVLDSSIELSDKLKQKGFVKSNNIFLREYKNVWEYNKRQKTTHTHTKVDKGNCFIATATMGSYDHPDVMELRNFRDNWILEKSWGERFVKWYYHYGQIASKSIEKSIVLKKISYILIVKPLVFISKLIKS